MEKINQDPSHRAQSNRGGWIFIGLIVLAGIILSKTPTDNISAPRNEVTQPLQGSPSIRKQVATYAQQMSSAMRMIAEGSSALASCYDFAICERSINNLIYKVEDARHVIAVARANEPRCMAEAGASVSAFVNRYYFNLLKVRYSLSIGFAGITATAQKATANLSDTKDVKADLERSLVACHSMG